MRAAIICRGSGSDSRKVSGGKAKLPSWKNRTKAKVLKVRLERLKVMTRVSGGEGF